MDGRVAQALQAFRDASGDGPPRWRRRGIRGRGTTRGRQERQATLVGSERGYAHQSAQRETSRAQSAIPGTEKPLRPNNETVLIETRGNESKRTSRSRCPRRTRNPRPPKGRKTVFEVLRCDCCWVEEGWLSQILHPSVAHRLGTVRSSSLRGGTPEGTCHT